jgi:hypothetical protein
VPLCVPEFGLALTEGDPTGAGRAQVMREHVAWLRGQPDVLAVGWWDIGGNQIRDREPERAVWRTVLEEAIPVAWYLNTALSTMRAEVNTRYPDRDAGSDGTLGDEAHQARASDHNPDGDGSVDAWDMDVEVNGKGRPYADDVESIKARFEAHPAARYWIHNDQIASRSDGWARRSYAYAGPNRNKHTQHVHFNTREEFENSDAPWGILEDEMDQATFTARLVAALGDDTVRRQLRAIPLTYPVTPQMSLLALHTQTHAAAAAAAAGVAEARAAAADDAARDQLVLAAVRAISGSGGPDAAPIIAAITAARDELRQAWAAEAARLREELEAARVRHAEAAQAAADALGDNAGVAA